MAMPFEVFARKHLLTWDHLQNPYTTSRELELKPEQKTNAIVITLIAAGVAAGASLVLDRSRTTLLVIAGGTALVTFYAVTGYFKWCQTQPPADGRKGPPREGAVEPRSGGRVERRPPRASSSPSAPKTGFATPDSTDSLETFRQKPNWLIPQRTSNSNSTGAVRFAEEAASLHREYERAYFASLWKSIYEDKTWSHRWNYSHQDEQLKNNKLSVIEGAPWEAFARFAKLRMQ